MGVYLYTVRKQVKTCDLQGVATPVALLKFLQRASYAHYGAREASLTEARLERARQCWVSLDPRPKHVALGDKFEDGMPVFEWDPNDYLWYDCDNIGSLAGYLRRVRKGRRVEWVVAPHRYEVIEYSRPAGRGLHSRREYRWTHEEALEVARELQTTTEDLEAIEVRRMGEVPEVELFWESDDWNFNRKLRAAAALAGIDHRETHKVLKTRAGLTEPLDHDRIATFQKSVAELTAAIA